MTIKMGDIIKPETVIMVDESRDKDKTCIDIFMDGKRLLAILPDGSIEKGEAFTTTDEAALAFWAAPPMGRIQEFCHHHYARHVPGIRDREPA